MDELAAKIIDADSVAEFVDAVTSDRGALDDGWEVFGKFNRLVDDDW